MSVFITGTDTDVGKTVLTAFLLAAIRAKGIDAVPMKPVQTGCEFGVVPDFEFYEKISQMRFEDQDLHVPYKYAPACSPHLAAQMANDRIDLNKIEDAFKKLSSKHQFVLVEGAGGIMVPLNENELMLDLMKKLDLPILLAARPSLGTINHVLLSLEVLRNGGLNVLGVIAVENSPNSCGFIETDNLKAIEKYGKFLFWQKFYIENLNCCDSLPLSEINKIAEILEPVLSKCLV